MSGVTQAVGAQDTPIGDILSDADNFVKSASSGGISDAVDAYHNLNGVDTNIGDLGNFVDRAIDPGNSVNTLAEATQDMPQSQADKDEQTKWAKNVEPAIGAAGTLVGGPVVGAAAQGFTSKIAKRPPVVGMLESGATLAAGYGAGAIGGSVEGAAIPELALETAMTPEEAAAAAELAGKAGSVIGGTAIKGGIGLACNATLNSGPSNFGTNAAMGAAPGVRSLVVNPEDVDMSQTANAPQALAAKNDAVKQAATYGLEGNRIKRTGVIGGQRFGLA